jgi:L-serine dehydratase
MAVDMPVNVPFDIMLAMASQVHILSGKYIVPTVVEYMEPFFKRKPNVESLVSQKVKDSETLRIKETLDKAKGITKKLAQSAGNILNTMGDAVVGGSSQAVGSPTNTARIAYKLAKGKIKKVTIELYPELFARRSINIPGILMGAVYGCSTSDYEMYKKSVDMVKKAGIQVNIVESKEYGVQKITIETDEMICMVDALNRGGGRLTLRNASPSIEKAKEAAKELGIVLV